ncbi:zinc finger CCCH domain-containing protein 37-like isoform X2 [Andrographis paniculata]|uniref:zinc finger CCCH domain-containing protein 37-like isoform X2 n=1 Tax=Andrographis paniculata TaxID=175694 RepID=UPI0021E87305|nr:zinc finger CCCH domain-containing protein 37-like isoform X2 [Andrographis paniculata]
MLYNHERYSPRVPGVSVTTPTHSYGPPGVDMGSTAATFASVYADLKRSSSESKRPRYENTSHLPIYPQRPGEKDCAYYMQTRTCKFGDSCIFDHPIWVPEGGLPDWKEVPLLPSEYLPERPGEPDCPFFLKTQRCKFGTRCKFNHPREKTLLMYGADNDGGAFLPERPSEPPCAFFMKTGQCKFGATCKFNHPRGMHTPTAGAENGSVMPNRVGTPGQLDFTPAMLHNSKGLPIRPGFEDCPFYVKTGSCKYGATCRYNHPNRIAYDPSTAAIVPSLLSSSSTPFNLGVASAASLLSTFDPRLAQSALGLGPTIYPQRPGRPECDYYMKTGLCKFRDTCKFHHPFDRAVSAASVKESQQQNVKLTLAGLPRREGAIQCPFYMKTGTCKYGPTCKFDHPPPGEVLIVSTSEGASDSAEKVSE